MTDTVDVVTIAAEQQAAAAEPVSTALLSSGDAPVSVSVSVPAPVPVSVSVSAPLSLPPPPLPTPAQASLGAVLAAVPSNTDAFFGHLVRCLQTRAGADAVLQFACYGCRLSGAVLEELSRSALRQQAHRLVAMAFKLPPSTSVVLAKAPAPAAVAVALKLAARFKAMAALLGETRTINRLWGLLGLYFALKKLVFKSRTKKTDAEKASTDAVEGRLDTIVAYTQVLVLIFYQAFENLAFLGSKKIIGLSPAMQGKLGILSVRCWGTYVGIELGRLLVERSRSKASGAAVKDAAWASNWEKSFVRNLAWLPLTVHWSVPNGPLPEILVSLLGMYPSTGQMVDLWRSTA